MVEKTDFYNCLICGSTFKFGNNRYDGKYIKKYDILVCIACWEANWDGWNPIAEARLIAHLKENNKLIPDRNEKGYLPRD